MGKNSAFSRVLSSTGGKECKSLRSKINYIFQGSSLYPGFGDSIIAGGFLGGLWTWALEGLKNRTHSLSKTGSLGCSQMRNSEKTVSQGQGFVFLLQANSILVTQIAMY